MRTRATRQAVEKRDAPASRFLGPHDPPVFGGVALVLPIMRPLGRLMGLEKWLTTAE